MSLATCSVHKLSLEGLASMIIIRGEVHWGGETPL